MSDIHKQNFFDTIVHIEGVKNTISGKNEARVKEAIGEAGYIFEKDYVRQHPIGASIVVDFAFIEEQVAIEVDGKSHRNKKQILKDEVRDIWLRENDWVIIRIDDKDFDRWPSFYYNLIKDVVEERREKLDEGYIQKSKFNRELDYDDF